jgi:hypothetical protein
MKIKVKFVYYENNKLGFNQIIFEKLRGSIWYDRNTFTAFEVDKINNESRCIFPNSKAEAILNILDSSTAKSIKIGDVIDWGVPYITVGEIHVIEIVEPSKSFYFGTFETE